jgi:hypothetical protein
LGNNPYGKSCVLPGKLFHAAAGHAGALPVIYLCFPSLASETGQARFLL